MTREPRDWLLFGLDATVWIRLAGVYFVIFWCSSGVVLFCDNSCKQCKMCMFFFKKNYTLLTFCFPPSPLSSTEIQNSRLWENVVVHEVGRAVCVCQNDGGRSGPREEIKGKVCLPARIDHEWVHWTTKALWHNESWWEPGFQRLWCSDAQRLNIKVGGII